MDGLLIRAGPGCRAAGTIIRGDIIIIRGGGGKQECKMQISKCKMKNGKQGPGSFLIVDRLADDKITAC
jgi:hypothetical protein